MTVVFPGAVRHRRSARTPGVTDAGHGRRAGVSRLTSATDAAKQIVAAVEKGSFRVVIGKDARALDRLSRLSPRRATEMIAHRMASLVKA